MALAHFYHSAGFMAGVDTHPYVPKGGSPEDTPHAVAAINRFGDDLLSDVTADGHQMVHQSSKVTGVILIHAPLTKKPPDSKEASVFLKIVKGAKSSAEHAAPTVLAHGKPLADCFVFMIGVNENCGSTPYNNLVLNYCTVVTKATIDDQVRKAIKSWVAQLVAWLEDLLKKKAADLIWQLAVKRFPPIKVAEPILKPVLDWLVSKLVDFLDWLINPADLIYKGIMWALGDDGKTSTALGSGNTSNALGA